MSHFCVWTIAVAGDTSALRSNTKALAFRNLQCRPQDVTPDKYDNFFIFLANAHDFDASFVSVH
jgi:hypothetical protein